MGQFVYEDDLLKHHIRTHAWLPLCQKRLEVIRKTDRRNPRRLRYFTFCAIGAIDVLMLDVAKVLRQSSTGYFDTVVFFDLTASDVDETKKRIPGATGFPGDFVSVMNDSDLQPGELELLEMGEDTAANREKLRNRIMKRDFSEQFPFDVVNLDLEEFVFKPGEPAPGEVVNALRRLFNLQKRQFVPVGRRKPVGLDSFSLMLTTQIGPPNLTPEYTNLLEERIQSNIDQNPKLRDLLQTRTGYATAADLLLHTREEFFRIGLPKIIAQIALEEDWHIDPEVGIQIFEIERVAKIGTYRMLHLVMDIKRNDPPLHRRNPGNHAIDGQHAYGRVAEQIFGSSVVLITKETVDEKALEKGLELIKSRRKKYYPEGDAKE